MSRVERHAAEEELKRSGLSSADAGTVAGAGAGAGQAGSGSKKKKHKGRVTPFGKLLNFIGTMIMLLTILLCLVLVVPRYAGIQSYVVISGSMEPEIPVGSMVYAKETTPATLKPGDIIVFYNTRNPGTDSGIMPVTHRVVENDKDKCEIITKGDANNDNDFSPVIYNNVVGIMIAHVPYLGYVSAPFVTMMGKIAIAMIIIAGYLLTEVGSRMRKNV